MTAKLLVFTLTVALAALASGVWGSDPCQQYANGCSTPFHMPVFYKTLFTPSCNKHDVCYRCGAKYGISKSTCDSTFLHNMDAACAVHDAGRRDLPSSSSFSSSSNGRKKRSACTVIAKDVFYEGVHLLGGLFYRGVGETESFCSEHAARGCLPH